MTKKAAYICFWQDNEEHYKKQMVKEKGRILVNVPPVASIILES